MHELLENIDAGNVEECQQQEFIKRTSVAMRQHRKSILQGAQLNYVHLEIMAIIQRIKNQLKLLPRYLRQGPERIKYHNL